MTPGIPRDPLGPALADLMSRLSKAWHFEQWIQLQDHLRHPSALCATYVPLPVDVLQCLTGRRALRVHSVTLLLSAQTSDSRTTSSVTQLGRMMGDVASSVGEHGREKTPNL